MLRTEAGALDSGAKEEGGVSGGCRGPTVGI